MPGAPFIRDLDDVRRWPTIRDLNMFHKLAHMSPALHSTAHHIVEPMDIKVSHRHLHITYSSMKHSDKTFMGMTTSGKNAEDVMTMCQILFGADVMEETPVVTGNCNGNSPLVWDETMLSAMRAFVKRRQPVLCSPFVLGGANTPASVAPAVAQLNAEALSALAYTHVIRKGDIQVMSAGTGIAHSEYNRNADIPVEFLQIWLFPRERNVVPRYDQRTLDPAERENRSQQVLGPDPNEAGVWVHQDLLGGVLTEKLGTQHMFLGLGIAYMLATLSMGFIPAMKEMNHKVQHDHTNRNA